MPNGVLSNPVRLMDYDISDQRDIRPVVSPGKGQCMSGAEEVPRAKPEALPRQNESTGFSQGICTVPLARDTTTYHIARKFSGGFNLAIWRCRKKSPN